MSTRQYIGARYVPKFYDFEGSTEWRPGVEYENLTVVTRNRNSYTSRKPVPANVGEPETNPEYWAATGLYNEQIEEYRQDVTELTNRVDTFEEETNYNFNKKLRVASFNVGLFNNGITKYSDRLNERLKSWRLRVCELGADIFCGQEITEYIDTNNTIASALIFSKAYPYNSHYDTTMGKYTYSKMPLNGGTNVPFTSDNARSFYWNTFEWCGHTVYLINTHLSIDADATIHRQSEIAQLVEFLSNKEYFMLCGDLNASDLTEWTPFINAGYNLANNGWYGTFGTWPNFNMDWTNTAIDNVITSNNIKMNNVFIDYRNGYSDHAALVVDLEI